MSGTYIYIMLRSTLIWREIDILYLESIWRQSRPTICHTIGQCHAKMFFRSNSNILQLSEDHIWLYQTTTTQQVLVIMFITWWRHQKEEFPALLALCEGNHRSSVDSPYKGQWCGALMFSVICAWTDDWVTNRDAGNLSRHRAHYCVIVMKKIAIIISSVVYIFLRLGMICSPNRITTKLLIFEQIR